MASATKIRAVDDAAAGDKPTFTRIKPASLADEVVEQIVEAIANGILAPGERLIETEIANQLHVSRVPVRDALRALEKQGIVVATPHRGARVMEINLDLYRQVQEVRLDLELRAIADLCARLAEEPAIGEELDRHLAELDVAVAANDRDHYNQLDIEFHRWICQSAQNHVVATLWEALSRHLTILLGLMTEDWQDIGKSQGDHRKLARLMKANDVERVRDLMTDHFFKDIERVDYDPVIHRFTMRPAKRRARRGR